jgi:hypothetical protein
MTRILWALSENIEIMTLIAMVLRLRIGVEKISSNGDRELTRLAPTERANKQGKTLKIIDILDIIPS